MNDAFITRWRRRGSELEGLRTGQVGEVTRLSAIGVSQAFVGIPMISRDRREEARELIEHLARIEIHDVHPEPLKQPRSFLRGLVH